MASSGKIPPADDLAIAVRAYRRFFDLDPDARRRELDAASEIAEALLQARSGGDELVASPTRSDAGQSGPAESRGLATVVTRLRCVLEMLNPPFPASAMLDAAGSEAEMLSGRVPLEPTLGSSQFRSVFLDLRVLPTQAGTVLVARLDSPEDSMARLELRLTVAGERGNPCVVTQAEAALVPLRKMPVSGTEIDVEIGILEPSSRQ